MHENKGDNANRNGDGDKSARHDSRGWRVLAVVARALEKHTVRFTFLHDLRFCTSRNFQPPGDGWQRARRNFQESFAQ
jgi:hypothetical protein